MLQSKYKLKTGSKQSNDNKLKMKWEDTLLDLVKEDKNRNLSSLVITIYVFQRSWDKNSQTI